jgi:hypothetical protein
VNPEDRSLARRSLRLGMLLGCLLGATGTTTIQLAIDGRWVALVPGIPFALMVVLAVFLALPDDLYG